MVNRKLFVNFLIIHLKSSIFLCSFIFSNVVLGDTTIDNFDRGMNAILPPEQQRHIQGNKSPMGVNEAIEVKPSIVSPDTGKSPTTSGGNSKDKGGWFGTSFCKPQTIDGLSSKLEEWSGVGSNENKQPDISEIKCAKINTFQDDAATDKDLSFYLDMVILIQTDGIKDPSQRVVILDNPSGFKTETENAKIRLVNSQKKMAEVSEHILGRIRDCAVRGKETDFTCCESTNPKSLEIRNMVGVAIPALGGMSAKLACSKFNDVMVGVGGLMTAWNASCAGFKVVCETACDKGVEGFDQYYKVLSEMDAAVDSFLKILDRMQEQINRNIKPTSGAEVTVSRDVGKTLAGLSQAIQLRKKSLTSSSALVRECAPKAKNLQVALERQAKQCQAWGKDMATSLLGIGGLIMQAKQKSKCGPAEEPNTCNPAAPTAATCAAFCADAANKSNPACRCILNPLASGCMDGSGRGYANGGGGGNYNSMNFNKPGAMAPGNDTTTNPAPEFGGPSSGVAGGGGRGGGGGGGLGGGSVLGSSSKPSGAGAAGKGGSRIDPNVISGFEGGGGASGSKAGGGYGANSAMMDKLKSELKAKADKLRGLASEDDPRLQITGAGGKTNWEKISDRYRDMTGQMIKDD